MGFGTKNWIEFFFLNESLQICALMFHGYSVDEFMKLVNRMFYDDVSPCECWITATPNEKVSNHPDAKGQKYFIAEFSYQPLPQEEAMKLAQATASLQLWRQDTTTGDAEIQLSQHWNPPHISEDSSTDKAAEQIVGQPKEAAGV